MQDQPLFSRRWWSGVHSLVISSIVNSITLHTLYSEDRMISMFISLRSFSVMQFRKNGAVGRGISRRKRVQCVHTKWRINKDSGVKLGGRGCD